MADETDKVHNAVPQILQNIQDRLAVTERIQTETLNILKDVAGSVTEMAGAVAAITRCKNSTVLRSICSRADKKLLKANFALFAIVWSGSRSTRVS